MDTVNDFYGIAWDSLGLTCPFYDRPCTIACAGLAIELSEYGEPEARFCGLLSISKDGRRFVAPYAFLVNEEVQYER